MHKKIQETHARNIYNHKTGFSGHLKTITASLEYDTTHGRDITRHLLLVFHMFVFWWYSTKWCFGEWKK